MIRLLATELLKLSRSKIFLVTILGILSSPLMNFLLFLAIKDQLPEKSVTLHAYLRQTNIFVTFLIGTMLFGLIATYLINREYQDNTLKNILAIPINRTQLIIAKTIILFAWIMTLVFLNFIVASLLGLTGVFTGVNLNIFIEQFKLYLLSGVLLFALTPVVMLITLVFKSYVHSIVFTIIVTFVGMIILNSKYVMIYPWTVPFALIAEEVIIKYPLAYSWISIGLTFIISLTGTIIYFNKTDIT